MDPPATLMGSVTAAPWQSLGPTQRFFSCADPPPPRQRFQLPTRCARRYHPRHDQPRSRPQADQRQPVPAQPQPHHPAAADRRPSSPSPAPQPAASPATRNCAKARWNSRRNKSGSRTIEELTAPPRLLTVANLSCPAPEAWSRSQNAFCRGSSSTRSKELRIHHLQQHPHLRRFFATFDPRLVGEAYAMHLSFFDFAERADACISSSTTS